MIRLFLLIIFFFTGVLPLYADLGPESAQGFLRELENVKNPFEDGLPKPVVVVPAPVVPEVPKPVVVHKSRPRRKHVVRPVITLPSLNLQGVIVGGEVHQAIINDQVVPLSGSIEGARVISVTREGVGLRFKGKKFFLKVE